MAEEGVHEIQVNGKQLVFLFMAGTVVAVVIFLCGVMVGRGVRIQQAALTELAAEANPDPTADSAVPGAPAESSSTPMPEDLSYPDRLAGDAAPPEPLRAAPEPQPPAEERAPAPRRDADARSTPPRRDPVARAEATSRPGEAFTVQVAAVSERGEAETIARRLTRKGYRAYVTPPAAGAPRVFRVRVGRFLDRREAESVAARLEREEQFKPWITR